MFFLVAPVRQSFFYSYVNELQKFLSARSRDRDATESKKEERERGTGNGERSLGTSLQRGAVKFRYILIFALFTIYRIIM